MVFEPETKYRRDRAVMGKPLCSAACGKESHRRSASATMARTNRKHASARMKANNPMARADVRAKVATTLRAMQWAPPVRGGNGTGPTAPQLALAAALGWPMEVAIPTGARGDGRGLPTAYKVDIANPSLMVAIEVDGPSHNALSRRVQDAKKTTFLASLGWTVLRFSNAEVTERLAECVQTVLSTISRSKGSTPTS